ncbi:CBS domain-containing protein [Actinokineospora auranticolor]|uniref:CBS domain-containing protein n=1 Tax=Actinokineospora auranticolor TaxID=155976 RepID=A0A2S6GQ58_9PSEU|nr:CBS domain-containing protein [Actinokineospora auranticolor]PPK67251.1 CBS domain-containing protein [Actinokineospora auranticolor]
MTGSGRVCEVMTGQVVGITPDAPVNVALRLMARSAVRHLPVITGERCVGVLHESDLLWHVWASGNDTTPVTQLMRPATPVVGPPTDVRAAAATMAAAVTDVLLVVDEGRLEGILTATDLVRALAG